ncbi:GGDEF domain-containing protein [Catellatospora citrea]|uniref:GGDEF domain-containing protein n=1 Tax=Catellatospora citrea TaxID=53366 RepID=UPI0033F98C03
MLAGIAVGVMAAAPALAYLGSRASRAEQRASRDPLTGISNRGTALQAFHNLAAGGHPPTVMFVDLDRFKQINDRYGHLAGDKLICTVAARLHRWAWDHDGLAGRLGGDEFILLIPDTSLTDAASAARDLRRAIAKPITVFHHRRHVISPSATVGVSTAAHNRNWTEALRAADIALYHAKRTRSGFAAFDPATVIPKVLANAAAQAATQ